MVSHPESVVADRPKALPPVPDPEPPASVASSRPHHHHQRGRSRHGSGGGPGGGGRSHHGGTRSSSSAQKNEFPIFSATGDVEIVIRAADQERKYLLHRLILAQCSGFFEAGTTEEWGRNSSPESNPDDSNEAGGLSAIDEGVDEGIVNPFSSRRAKPLATLKATKTRWRYELDWENREEDAVPILVQKVEDILYQLPLSLWLAPH